MNPTLLSWGSFPGLCPEIFWHLEIMPNHLHLFVSAKPTITPFKIVQKLKGNTSIQLRRLFPQLKYFNLVLPETSSLVKWL